MPALTKTFQFSPYQKEGLAAEANINFDDFALYINTWDGWQSDKTTWTRTGNHTFTVPTDLTARYSRGTKVRYKDGGNFEYGVVLSSAYVAPTTTVTLITNSDYVMAAATITDNEYSYANAPQGFPQYFSYASTWTAASVNPAIGDGSQTSRFSVNGKTVHVQLRIVFGGTTTGGTGAYRFTLPTDTNATVQAADQIAIGQWHGANANAGPDLYGGIVRIHATSSATIEMLHFNLAADNGRHLVTGAAAPFAWGNTDYFGISCHYEMA